MTSKSKQFDEPVKLSDEDKEQIRVICEQLSCTPKEAITIALKARAHELTCKRAHQQNEPSRH